MGRSRFVQPGTVVLNLAGGDWIEVKKRLNVGEARAAYKQIIGEVNREGWQRPNYDMVGISEVHAYIVDWGGDGFRDPEGRRVEPTLASLQAMGLEDFAEIERAIKAHIEAMDQEASDQKKTQTGSPVSEPIL